MQTNISPAPSGSSPSTGDGDDTAPRLGSAIVGAVVAATMIVFSCVGAVVWIITDQLASGVGVGAFTAAWAGVGFGTMSAAATHTLRVERRGEGTGHGPVAIDP